VPFPYKSGGGDVLHRAIDYFGGVPRNSDTAPCRFPTNRVVVMCSVRAIDYFGVAPRNSDTAVPFPYKSGDGDVLCAGDRLFWGRETARRRVLFCLHRAIEILG
jgi:hypothetical protein